MERPADGLERDTGDTTIASNLRCNERIRVSPVRLIDENNEQVGIVEVKEAQKRAYEAGLDLVEVAPKATPPVCRIMDYGKWKYAQAKRERKSKSMRHETELKSIRIKTPKIGQHDLDIKVARARMFLERGDRVQFSLRFRGRELAHIDEGQRIFNEITETLSDVSRIDQHYRREGRRITMTLGPLGKSAKAAKPASAPPAETAAAAKAAPAKTAPATEAVAAAEMAPRVEAAPAEPAAPPAVDAAETAALPPESPAP